MEHETTPVSVQDAIEYNRASAQNVGWENHRYDIYSKVLKLNYSPDEALFVSLVAEWQYNNGLTPDGKLGKKTWERMKSVMGLSGGSGSTTGLRLPLVNTPMPDGNSYTVANRHRRYGVPEAIRALQWIAAEWHKLYPDIRFGVNDISQQGGGEISPHKSHRVGLDADLTLTVRSTGERIGQYRQGSGTRIVRNYAPYRQIASDFVALAARNPHMRIKTIFYFDRSISPLISTSRDSDNHYRHFHVRFCLPEPYRTQMNFRAVYKSGEKPPNYSC